MPTSTPRQSSRASLIVGLALSSLAPMAGTLVAETTNTAIEPMPKDANWLKMHESFVTEAKADGAALRVLFLGDSITDFWRQPERGKATWDVVFAPMHAANFGISGDRTQNVLWRIDHGELDGISPRVVVLLIGTNNTGLEHDGHTPRNSTAETIEGVTLVVKRLREKLPQSQILLLALLPRAKPDDPQRAQVRDVNEGIRPLADAKWVHWLDLGDRFLAPDGTIPESLMPDMLHPSTEGYRIFAEGLRQPIEDLLKQATPLEK